MGYSLPKINYREAVMLLTTLGQLKQIIARLPSPPASDHEYDIIHTDSSYTVVLTDLEVDLFTKLNNFLNFLEKNNYLDDTEIEVQYLDNEKIDEHNVLLTNDCELILLHSTNLDKERMQSNLMIEWTKRVIQLTEK